MDLENAVNQIRGSEKRKFTQTIDLIITLKNIDLKKPENKFSKRVILPHGRGKDVSICLIAENGDIGRNEIEDFGKNKVAAKKISKKYEFFVCEAPLMPTVGKVLGRYLAPKGKMPEVLPPGRAAESLIGEIKRSARIRLRDSPTIQTVIGTEGMKDEEIKENAARVLEEIKKALPPKAQIRGAYLKTTMGKPLKIGVS